MELLKEYFFPWSISNVVAILMLITALKKPRLARLLFVLLFTWACWFNYTTAHNDPEVYLDYARLTPFDWLRDFINGWFAQNINQMISFIAIGQGLIAIGMLLKGWFVRIACFGAILFFMAIAPLGIGAAFPFSVTASLAAYFIIKKDGLNYLWRRNKV
ncbi:MAG: hypothetical protein ABJM06_14680 [Gilvibacter sp.]